MKPETHNFNMRVKRLLLLKEEYNLPLRTTTVEQKKSPQEKEPFFYQYIIDSITNNNKLIVKEKVGAKTIYQNIIQK